MLALSPRARRLPEMAGLDGWPGQFRLWLDGGRGRAARRVSRAGTSSTGALVRQVLEASADGADPVVVGPRLCMLLDDGLIGAPVEWTDADPAGSGERILTCLALASRARSVPLDIATVEESEADALQHRLAPVLEALGLDCQRLRADDPGGRAPVRIGSLEAFAINVLAGRLRPEHAGRRLCLVDADRQILDRATRRVRLHRDVERPDLSRRIAEAHRIAGKLLADRDYSLREGAPPVLTEAGEARLASLVPADAPWWQGPSRRRELVCFVLGAMHVLLPGGHARVEDGRLRMGPEPLPEDWPQSAGDVGLEPVLRRLAGLPPAPFRVVAGETTVLALIGRYPRLCGILREAASDAPEFRRLFGLGVMDTVPRVPAFRLSAPCMAGRDALVGALGQAPEDLALVVPDPEDADAIRAGGGWRDGQGLELDGLSLPVLTRGRRAAGTWLVGGPVRPRERRRLHILIERRLGPWTGDLIGEHHGPVLSLAEHGSLWTTLFARTGSAALQSWVLGRSVARLESLETASRIALYRAAVAGRPRYAFLGESTDS